MGQEIAASTFTENDFKCFQEKLQQETQQLQQRCEQGQLNDPVRVAGLEVEAWLVNPAMQPCSINDAFLAILCDPLANAELAKFNIEFNTQPVHLTGSALNQLQQQLQNAWSNATQQAQKLDCELLMTGILPTLQQSDLTMANMSELNRYRALNEQILSARGCPVELNINGIEHLSLTHNDVMLESAATSLQLHTQIPLTVAHHYYNASMIASAAIVAVSANSPFLFGKDLWHESRIPLFEQAIESGGYTGAHGPLKRVGFGSAFAKTSILECFQENLEHYPILLPVDLGENIEQLHHLRLHNGTIWRWNRPLIGFDDSGKAHIRIEHRTPAAGPTVMDMLANTAFYFGLSHALCDDIVVDGLPLSFSNSKDNFYKSARYGLDAHIIDFSDQHKTMQHWVLDELLEKAQHGLDKIGIKPNDVSHYLGIIEHRVNKQQTGSHWQRAYIAKHGRDFQKLTRQYLFHQQQGEVVSRWPL